MTVRRTLLSLLAAALSTPCAAARAQSPTQSHLRDPPAQTDAADPRVRRVIERAEQHFKLGESALASGNKKEAREEFDKAVDAVLESGLDVRADPRLKHFYDGLVERIYRHETSSDAPRAGPRREAGFAEQQPGPSAAERSDYTSRGEPARPRLSVKNVPPNYAGDDAANVFTAVAAVKPSLSKGKFETTPEYLERIDKLLSRLRVDGAKTAKDELTFVVTPSEDYDADARVYTVKVETSYVGELASEKGPQGVSLSDRRARSVALARASKTLGSAVGRTAFGVRRRYVVRSYSTLKLVMPERKTAAWADGLEIPEIPPAKARQLMGRVRVAIRGRLASPYASSASDRSAATLSDPEEAHYRDLSIYFEPDTIFAFDLRTGEPLGVSGLNGLPKDRYGLHPSSTLTLERPAPEREAPGRDEPAPPQDRELRERRLGARP
jgi:hypothetical protein